MVKSASCMNRPLDQPRLGALVASRWASGGGTLVLGRELSQFAVSCEVKKGRGGRVEPIRTLLAALAEHKGMAVALLPPVLRLGVLCLASRGHIFLWQGPPSCLAWIPSCSLSSGSETSTLGHLGVAQATWVQPCVSAHIHRPWRHSWSMSLQLFTTVPSQGQTQII